MTTPIDHNKLLKKIAREQLKPHGILQQGQSRTFLYDKGWYTVVIEFQPSSWSKGTYLNIGVDFNFYPRDYFAFAYGYREEGFEEFKDEAQFTECVNLLCQRVIKRVAELEQKFADYETALKTVQKDKVDDIWRIYEVAVLNILTANFNKAQKLLLHVRNAPCEYDWEIERKNLADELWKGVRDNPTHLAPIQNIMIQTRQLKKLPTLMPEKLTEKDPLQVSASPKAKRAWWQKLFGSE